MKNTIKTSAVLKFCSIGLAASSLASCGNSGKIASKPNVIILLTDDQGYGDLGCTGNPYLKTPNLDSLYVQSAHLCDFHVAPVSTPTRGQLLTGIDAVRNGASSVSGYHDAPFLSYTDTNDVSHKVHLIPEVFKANGYVTGHFGKWHLGDNYPYRAMDRGFDESLTFKGASIWQSPNDIDNDCFDDILYRNGERERAKGYYTDVFFDETIKFIKKSAKKKKPFFVYLPTGAMHTPLFVAEKYSKPYRSLPPLTAQFYGMIANYDENMGKLDAALDELGIKDNTIVVFMTDNGGTLGVKFYNAGMKGHKGDYFEGGHRVPCFIRWKNGGVKAGLDVPYITEVQDIMPSLVKMCGLKDVEDYQTDGKDLSSVIGIKESTPDKISQLKERMEVVQYMRKGECHEYTVMYKKWRLINGTKLYNLENDLEQKNNVIKQNKDIAKKMQNYYEDWKKGVAPSEKQLTTIVLGDSHEKKVALSCFDWMNVEGWGNISQTNDIRQGMPMHGTWHIEASQTGNYQFTFSRWPLNLNRPLTAGLPIYQTEFAKQIGKGIDDYINCEYYMWKTICVDGLYPDGVNLPITKGELILDGKISKYDSKDSASFIRFTIHLDKGIHDLGFNFLNSRDEIMCGAYCGEVEIL